MKKLYTKKTVANTVSIKLMLFAVLLISAIYTSYGQVRVPFAPRTSDFSPTKTNYTLKGDFTMIGNTNLKLAGVTYPSNDSNDNDMEYVDIDGDINTWNSSSANLTFSNENGANQECSNIIYAGLYWTGRAFGDGETDSETFQVSKQVPTGNFILQQQTSNLQIRDNESTIPFTNYSVDIVRTGNNNDRIISYVFTTTGAGNKVEFVYRNNGGDQTLHAKVNNGAESLLLDDTISGDNIDANNAYPNTPYVVFNNLNPTTKTGYKIEVTRLRRNGSNSTAEDTNTRAYITVTYYQSVAEIATVTKNFDKRKVSIKGPLASGYTQLTANGIAYPTNGDDRNMYSAYAEVTDYVKQYGIGEYFVADMALREGNVDGTGFYGGWGMVIVYENSKMKWRDITVFDGHAFIRRPNFGEISETLNVSGFNAVQNGNVNLKLGLMAGEGDIAFTGDYFRIERRNTGVYDNLSHSNNSATNFFNSSIVTGGNARNPNYQNNTGVDIAMFEVDNGNNDSNPSNDNQYITNNQTSTSFKYGSAQDTYIIFNITFSVDAYIPEPEVILTTTAVNTSGANPNALLPGESADYKIEIRNKGTEAITNTIITIPVPYTSTYQNLSINYNVYGSFTPLSPPTYDPNAGATGSIIWNLGTLPSTGNPNEVLADISFTLKATTDCSLLVNANCDSTISLGGSISGTGATSDTAA